MDNALLAHKCIELIENNENLAEIKGIIKLYRALGARRFVLKLVNCGSNKIAVIKEIRSLQECGLKEAKERSETPGYLLLQTEDEVKFRATKSLFESAGAQVEVQHL